MSRYASIEAAQSPVDAKVAKTVDVRLNCKPCGWVFVVAMPVLLAPCVWAQCAATEAPDDTRRCPGCGCYVGLRRAGAMCHP